jgi:putative glycosyltransferase (TIGR04372 family)
VLSLTDFDRKRGWVNLRRLAVPENAWFACVHCRESDYSYKRGRDIATIHDADVNNYFPAMEEIVDRGGWIIRIGDPFMKPIPKMKNVIDYAHLDIKSDWMDVFLCASCKFLLGSNSGLSALPSAFGVPCAIANVGGPISAVLPYGPEDIGIPKFLWSEKEKRYLNFQEILSSPVGDFPFDYLFSANDIRAVENSPEDIKELAIEMLDRLEGKLEYSEEDERLQAHFKSLMKPGHYSYGAISRVGRDFLRKYERLL